MHGIGELVGGMADMVLWQKRGDRISVAELDNGCTIVESDTMPQVLNMPDIPGVLETETRKHLPKGYVVQAGREENMHAYHVNVWRIDPEKAVQGLEDVVIRILIGHEALLNWFQHSADWRLDLLYHLQKDLDERSKVPD